MKAIHLAVKGNIGSIMVLAGASVTVIKNAWRIGILRSIILLQACLADLVCYLVHSRLHFKFEVAESLGG